jgi:quinoprotein glucose dehydrogenase
VFDIWDADIATPMLLYEVEMGGQPRKALAAIRADGLLFLFDRETGEPLIPIEQRPVPQDAGLLTAATQPFPVGAESIIPDCSYWRDRVPPPFPGRPTGEAERLLRRYQTGPVFTPPVVSDLDGAITSFRSSGGTNWPGGAFDPETQILYAPSYTSMVTIGLLPPPNPEFSDIRRAGPGSTKYFDPSSVGRVCT